MLFRRREFLRRCVVVGTAAVTAPYHRFGAMAAHAQEDSDYKALVCIFLTGGNDSNNLIVPIDSRYGSYAQLRGRVALPANELLPAGGGGFGFHPALPTIQRLYEQRQAAGVFNVGTLVGPTSKAGLNQATLPHNLQSHSDQTQQWQSSDPTGGTTGWAGRLADVMSARNTASPTSVTASGGNPLFLTGERTSAVDITETAGLRSFGSSTDWSARSDALQRLLTFDSGLKLITTANGVLTDAMRSSQEINAALAAAPALPVTFPNLPLANQLAQMAKLLSVREALGMKRQIFFASMAGFDTHQTLLPVHEQLLSQFDQSIAAFMAAVDAMGLTGRVTVFTESEFNRTADANASLGTDHAWGGHHLVIGGAVRGGNMYGQFPTLALRGPDDLSSRGVWIPTTSLDQYASTMAGWFGVEDANLDAIFPNLKNFPARRLHFLPSPSSPFTDDPLLLRNTRVRAAHLNELRAEINRLRQRGGLAAATWTDQTVIPGVTIIRRVHLTELRAALDAVYVAASRTPPNYSPLSTAAPIVAEHVAELRMAIVALW